MHNSKISDIAWSILFVAIIIICISISIFAFAAYLTPAAFQAANCAPQDTLGTFISLSLILCGLFFGAGIALMIVGLISRQFVNGSSYERWVEQFDVAKPKMPKQYQILGDYVTKITKPNGYVISPSNKSSNLTGEKDSPSS